ncbi:alpha-tocopherol transfer protein-like [Folsomia candida]|uniref:alpha-tocopherol transfer protein-like n=1 Tax=Folsomia candida TaxID=158441 RepID=UPI000B9015BC|nr:alpha-tocopherol transfer protein-like [Folsomia candida]
MSTPLPTPSSPPSDTTVDIDQVEKDCVEKLKTLIKDDPELPPAISELSDEFYLLLIRARRNRPEVSLKLIKSLIHFKTHQYPDLFTDLEAFTIEPVMENEMIRVVKRGEGYTGPTVIVFRTTQWDTSLADIDMLIKAGFLYALQMSTASNPTQERAGIVMILDMAGFSFSHARECTYSSVLKVANCIIFGSPFRINSAFITNSPYIFEKVFAVVKFAIPEFYRNFITVTTQDFTKLHSLVEPDLLPESLGGSVPEEEGWEEGVEDAIRDGGGGSQLVYELMDAVERQEENKE